MRLEQVNYSTVRGDRASSGQGCSATLECTIAVPEHHQELQRAQPSPGHPRGSSSSLQGLRVL